MERKPQEQDRYIVRFPDGMRDKLKREAEMAGRSLNAEIVTRLEASLASGNSIGGTVDQIFSSTINKLLDRPEQLTERQFARLTAEYEEFKRTEIAMLRQFLDVVSSVAIGSVDDQTLKYQESREMENEFHRIRAWADAWGYDVVKRSKTKPLKNRD